MKIDRTHVMEQFASYTDRYDSTDEKIKLKIDHTYRVAQICERIAISEGMSEADVELAWLLGMLHDIGRFEQLRRFGTFNDAESIDHAKLGADILFGSEEKSQNASEKLEGESAAGTGQIRNYVKEPVWDELIDTAIRVHSAYRIPQGLSEHAAKLCHVLRDADKIDILRVNVEVPLEEIYNTTTEALETSEVTPAVMDSFYEHHATLKSIKRTPVDHVVGHISLVYELVYRESYRIVREQGYLNKLMHFKSKNPRTAEDFAKLRAEMQRYLESVENA